jgi:hypothetical protein
VDPKAHQQANAVFVVAFFGVYVFTLDPEHTNTGFCNNIAPKSTAAGNTEHYWRQD